MTGLPHPIRRRWRGEERAVSIERGLDRLLDLLDEGFTMPPETGLAAPDDLLPLSTGIVGLDRVLGGGVRRGEVAWVGVDLPSHSVAIAHACARSTPHRCLLDASAVLSSVAWLVAGASGVPCSGVRAGRMSQREWDAMTEVLDGLSERDLFLSSVGSVGALSAVVREIGPALVVVDDPDRLDDARDLAEDLVDMARSARVAVLVAAPVPLCDEIADADTRIRWVTMSSKALGSSAVLLSSDPDDMVAFGEVRVDLQRARVW